MQRSLAMTLCALAAAVTMSACASSIPNGASGSADSPSSPVSAANTTSPAATPQPAAGQTTSACASIAGHRYEACTAYIVNDAHWSLQPYYKYVHSDSVFAFLKDRLTLKYRGQALQTIQHRTANWPQGTNEVDGPDITILKAWASLACNKAVLTTRENWTVIAPDGTILYQEQNQIHTVVLRRVPDERFTLGNLVLHQWVVTAIYNSGNGAQQKC